MTNREVMQQALEALEKSLPRLAPYGEQDWLDSKAAISALRTALAQPEQEPVAWNVIDPTGNILATEKNAIRGWARVNGYKPTVEGLLGLHELGWRVLPTSPPAPKRPWVGLTDDDWAKIGDMPDTFDQGVAWAQARLMERNK